MSKKKINATPIAILKTVSEPFEQLCDENGISLSEAIAMLMERAIDEWDLPWDYYYDYSNQVETIKDWKDIKTNAKK